MAPFGKTAVAVCLLAFSGLQSEAAEKYKFTLENVKTDDYVYANLVRNGKLPTHINEVTMDQDLVNTLNGKVEQNGTTEDLTTCDALIKASTSGSTNTMFYHAFKYPDNASPDYRQLLQDALDAGLAVFTKEYPKTDKRWKEIWADGAGASLAYFLESSSTKIGCVVGKCTEVDKSAVHQKLLRAARNGNQDTAGSASQNNAVLFCQLNPAADKNSAPFNEEYFNGLVARTAKLEEMTEDDLKAPVEEGAGTTATPTILIAGLVAMLAAASA